MTGAVAVVLTSVATRDAAEALARALVAARLAACVQVLPVASTYRWNSAIESADEWLLLCKIRADDAAAVEAAIAARHPYEVPEIVTVQATRVAERYGQWLFAETDR